MFRPITFTLIAAIGILSQVPTARAEAKKHSVVAAVRVDYSDLDIQKEHDAHVLLARLDRAAFKACGGDPQWHPQYRLIPKRVRDAYLECRKDAVSRAVEQVNARQLWLAYAAASGGKSEKAPRDARS